MNEVNVTCIVCGNSLTQLIPKYDYEHRSCLDCGHTFLYPLPTVESSEEFHKKDYQYQLNERKNLLQKYGFIPKLDLNQSSTFLDIGSADGSLLILLKELGFKNVFGLEVNDSLANVARSRGLEIVSGYLDSDKFVSMKFDYIHLGDVLEHIPNLDLVFENLVRLLKIDGKVIITTPNLHSLWGRLTLNLWRNFNIPWSCLTPPHHVNNFTKKSLRIMFEKYGFCEAASVEGSHSFIYELSSLRLRRKFIEEPNIANLVRLLWGYSAYFFAQLVYLLLIPWKGDKFKMTLIGALRANV